LSDFTNTPLSGALLKRTIVEFVRAASFEFAVAHEPLLPALTSKLPPGMTVYVSHTPKASLEDVVRVALKVEACGFRASPHIVARRIESKRRLRDALRELRDGSVEQLLLVAGDNDVPVGKLESSLDILETSFLVESGFRRIGVAGHPEGHRTIGPTGLWSALSRKQAYAQREGVAIHIVTQFGFDPRAVCMWDRRLAQEGISLPVHVGIVGPMQLPKLLKFAMRCGVRASLRSLIQNISAVTDLRPNAVTPDEFLIELVRCRAENKATRIVQPHLYSFGGSMATARWLRAAVDGTFELSASENRFEMI